MKKIISIFATTLLIVGLFTTTSLADPVSTKDITKLKNQLSNAQNQLVKLNDRQTKIETAIQKAISNDGNKVANTAKQIENNKTAEDKLQASLDKMIANDKIEQENLTNDISKATTDIQNQENALTTQLATIDANLSKQIAELNTKLASAKDDATKNSIQALEASANTLAGQKRDAINTYLTTIKADFTARQAIWASRQDLLTKRQTARTA